MGLLSRVRGLWRFDGDEEPIQVSRRKFLFVGGTVLAGAAVPGVLEALAPPRAIGLLTVTGVDYTTRTVTLDSYPDAESLNALFKEKYRHVVPALYEAEHDYEAFLSRIERGRKIWEGDQWYPIPQRRVR